MKICVSRMIHTFLGRPGPLFFVGTGTGDGDRAWKRDKHNVSTSRSQQVEAI